jgi:hypothetical protein
VLRPTTLRAGRGETAVGCDGWGQDAKVEIRRRKRRGLRMTGCECVGPGLKRTPAISDVQSRHVGHPGKRSSLRGLRSE